MIPADKTAQYLANLRGLYLIHQNHHWVTSGANFYGNHLLFQRIYESAQKNADQAAEKFIGLYGSKAINIKEQLALITECVEKYADGDQLVQTSLAAEKDFLTSSEEFYEEFKEEMSLGLDDLILSIANDREEAVYLLQQNFNEDKMDNKLSAVANKFQQKLAQMQGPQMTPEQSKAQAEKIKLQEAAERAKQEFASALGLKNLSPEDLKFVELSFVQGPDGKQSIAWKLSVSPAAAKQFSAAVAKNRQSAPSFQPGTYMGQLLTRHTNMPVMPAQPIMVG